MRRFEIEVVQDGRRLYAVPLLDAPLHIGRAPTNHLVFSDTQISWHHAQIWAEGERVWVRDMGSRNGTWLDDQPVTTPTVVKPGSPVRVGPDVLLRVVSTGSTEAVPRVLQVEDIDRQHRILVRGDRFHFGSGADAHLLLTDAPRRAATLTVHADGELWLGVGDEEGGLELGEPFEVAGRQFRIIEASDEQAPTVEHDKQRYPYALYVTLDGSSGAEAVLTGPDDLSAEVSGNGAVLLYVLARALADDPSGEGWCSDEDAVVGVWGRSGTRNSLHVLVHRLRGRLEKAGFDPWFVEKKRRAIRARLGHFAFHLPEGR